MAGIDIAHVPYKGAAPAVVDLLAGQVDLALVNVSAVLPHIKAGKLRALAVATMHRSTALPDVPTLNESGISGFDSGSWYDLAAPAATPKPVIDVLYTALAKVIGSPEMKAKLQLQGAEAFLLNPQDTLSYIRDDAARVERVIKSAGIKLD